MPKYDVCLSFAGEDRDYVEEVARHLTDLGVSRFYDTDEQADLWGKNLVEHLDQIYRKDSRFCVMFISEAYARKMWTKHERQAAFDRAMVSDTEYVLPAQRSGEPGVSAGESSRASTFRFCTGWVSQAIASAKARAFARCKASKGNSGGVGWVSSSHSMMASDWVSTPPSPSSSVGTSPCGLSAR